jgi:hypothetical protein
VVHGDEKLASADPLRYPIVTVPGKGKFHAVELLLTHGIVGSERGANLSRLIE